MALVGGEKPQPKVEQHSQDEDNKNVLEVLRENKPVAWAMGVVAAGSVIVAFNLGRSEPRPEGTTITTTVENPDGSVEEERVFIPENQPQNEVSSEEVENPLLPGEVKAENVHFSEMGFNLIEEDAKNKITEYMNNHPENEQEFLNRDVLGVWRGVIVTEKNGTWLRFENPLLTAIHEDSVMFLGAVASGGNPTGQLDGLSFGDVVDRNPEKGIGLQPRSDERAPEFTAYDFDSGKASEQTGHLVPVFVDEFGENGIVVRDYYAQGLDGENYNLKPQVRYFETREAAMIGTEEEMDVLSQESLERANEYRQYLGDSDAE